MTAAPLTLMGIDVYCPRCMAAPGTARKYVLDAIAGRWGA